MTDAAGTILIVDDDLFSAELAGMALEAAGHSVLIAEGALDALEQLAQDPSVRVIVSDLNMPIMDGVQFFRELRQQGFTQPFILLSSQTMAPEGIAALLPKDEHLQDALPEKVAALLAGDGQG
jgi:two-component system chemotaxis response regulator CheY